MIYHLSLSISNVHFFSYYGACHFSKRKKVMRIQCKVLSYPPLFSGPDGMSTATPSALESEAVHLQFSLPVQFSLPSPPSWLRLSQSDKCLSRGLCGVRFDISVPSVGHFNGPHGPQANVLSIRRLHGACLVQQLLMSNKGVQLEQEESPAVCKAVGRELQ